MEISLKQNKNDYVYCYSLGLFSACIYAPKVFQIVNQFKRLELFLHEIRTFWEQNVPIFSEYKLTKKINMFHSSCFVFRLLHVHLI